MTSPQSHRSWIVSLAAALAACQGASASPEDPLLDIRGKQLVNPAPYIPPHCYAKTEPVVKGGEPRNSCYVCHQSSRPPNYIDDRDLQLEYSFAEPARVNHWRNAFVDRRVQIAEVSDSEILEYVRFDNYRLRRGGNAVAARLAKVPEAWDVNKNGRWDGFVPDAAFRFDERGFDRDAAGRYTGWRAYAWVGVPGFLPGDGSSGDALIRLPEVFRRARNGEVSRRIYELNLAILEAVIKREDVAIDSVDEKALGVDLDRDGRLGVADRVVFRWRPLAGEYMSWVGQARDKSGGGEVYRPTAGLFPVGTEILHSVRYLDLRDGRVVMAPRMKELRYTRKRTWQSYSELEQTVGAEALEKEQFPDRLRQLIGDAERGLNNGSGWILQGFIEDASGRLRPQSYEETAFCVGCHGGVGATDDSIFSFGRKLPGTAMARGWFHRSQSPAPAPERHGRDGRGEYSQYRQLNGSDSAQLSPSSGRALTFDKLYREIVREQSYVRGREPVFPGADEPHHRITASSTAIKKIVQP
jgi:hypothetical protein